MADFWSEIAEKAGGFAGKWTAYTAFGSFSLYLLGYLTLRSQLSTFGVTSSLDVFDQKYLFAGCRFLVYLAVSVPSVLIVALLLIAIGYMPYKLIPLQIRNRVRQWMTTWCASPARVSLLGVVIAVASIQFVLRRCFDFGNILLSKSLPDEWLGSVLLTSGSKLALYFMVLVACTLLAGYILFYALRPGDEKNGLSQFLTGLLAFLVMVEFLLLPVNFGALITTQQLPRVAEVNGEKLPEGACIWLVWETKEDLTYLVRDSGDQRALLVVPRKETKLKIVAYDDIFHTLFSSDPAGSRSCLR